MADTPTTPDLVQEKLATYTSALRRFLETALCTGTEAEAADLYSPWGADLNPLRWSLNRALAVDILILDQAWCEVRRLELGPNRAPTLRQVLAGHSVPLKPVIISDDRIRVGFGWSHRLYEWIA